MWNLGPDTIIAADGESLSFKEACQLRDSGKFKSWLRQHGLPLQVGKDLFLTWNGALAVISDMNCE